MNKKLLTLLIPVLIFILGCSKSAQKEADEANAQTEGEIPFDGIFTVPQGVFIIDGYYCIEKDDGKMDFKAYLNAGDTVNWTGEKKDAVRAYDGETRVFYRVEVEEKGAMADYWVHDYYIAGPAVPAVIVSAETVLYTRPDPSAVARTGTVTLPQYMLVAMLDDDDLTDDFIPVTAQAPNGRLEGRYVKIKDISWDPNDIGGVKIARAASITTVAAARKELLKNAMDIISNGKNLYNVPAYLNFDPALFELEVTGNLELLDNPVEYTVTDETVNSRDLPSITGNITGTMAQGETFWVKARTKNEITLNVSDEESEKPKGRWLLAEGGYWVFSAYAAIAR